MSVAAPLVPDPRRFGAFRCRHANTNSRSKSLRSFWDSPSSGRRQKRAGGVGGWSTWSGESDVLPGGSDEAAQRAVPAGDADGQVVVHDVDEDDQSRVGNRVAGPVGQGDRGGDGGQAGGRGEKVLETFVDEPVSDW